MKNFLKRLNILKLFESIPVQEQINFARHLSIVIKAGLPLYQGLKIIRDQSESKLLKTIIDQVLVDVNSGRFLADSLERYRNVFGDFFINIIRVGEGSGTLSKNLTYLAEELKKSKTLKTKVRSAMVYPAIIMVTTIGVTGFLTFYVFPKLLPVFSGLKVKLPTTTVALISFVDFIKTYGIYLAIFIFAAILVVKILLKKSHAVRYAIDLATLYVPVVSQLVINVNMANLARVLGLLLKSGVKIIEAITITSTTLGNAVYQDIVAGSTENVRRGGQLATFLAKHRHLFPPLFTGMVQIGEDTGNLEDNLAYLSDYYDEEVGTKLQNLTNLLEPFMLLLMGGIVGFVAISIITPIYSLSQGVK
jgi:type IV pilus assembly protein PilC